MYIYIYICIYTYVCVYIYIYIIRRFMCISMGRLRGQVGEEDVAVGRGLELRAGPAVGPEDLLGQCYC